MERLSYNSEIPITHPERVVVIGPSGAGKTTIIREVAQRDPRIVLNPIHVDRPLRKGEFEKFYFSREEIDVQFAAGEYDWVDPAFEHRYAVPKKPVQEILKSGRIAIQDSAYASVVRNNHLSIPLHVIYILPPSLSELRRRLSLDKRDITGSRFEEGRRELLEIVHTGGFKDNPHLDDVIINKDLNQAVNDVMQAIYRRACR